MILFDTQINHRGQIVSYNDYLRSLSTRKRQRRDVLTPETVLRFVILYVHLLLLIHIDVSALKIDQDHRRSRHHQFEVASRRASNNNLEVKTKIFLACLISFLCFCEDSQ
jgi:hypothetical protein